MHDLIGRELGQYEVTALVRDGEFCRLYLARELESGREVALKVILPDAAADDMLIERFQRAARGAAALHHPGIAEVLGSGVVQVDGERIAYMVTPFIDGSSLEDEWARLRAAHQVMDRSRALGLLHTLAVALDYAHHRGLRHLDLKPSNVMLTAGDQPVITDFGLAETLGTGRLIEAGAESVRPYHAPELLSAAQIDGSADVYSLGLIAAQLLTGRFPSDPPGAEPLGEQATALASVLARAVDGDPARRYRTAGELVAAIEAAMTEIDSPPPEPAAAVRREGPIETDVSSASAQPPQPAPAKEGVRQFLVQILAVVTAVMALLDKSLHAVSLLRNPLIGLAVVGIGVGAMLLSAGYVLARPRSFSKRQRNIAVIGLVVTLLAAGGWGGWTLYDMSRPPKGLIVLIADFDQAPGAKSVNYARRIESGLNQALTDLKVEGVYVERADEVYSSTDAREKASTHKAAVVIYGWYDDAGVNPSFELVRAPQQFAPIVKQATVGLASLDRLDLRVDKELQEMSYIAAATIGLVYYADGQDAQALPFFEAALSAVPDETLLMGKDAILLYRAACQFNRRSFTEAAESLEQAIALNPDLYEARQNLAIAYNINCNLTGALQQIDEALRLRPDSADAYHLRGLLLSADGRSEDAIASLTEAVKLAPDDGNIHLALAQAYSDTGRIAEAETEYRLAEEKAVVSESDPDDGIQATAARADALMGQGDIEGALVSYGEAIDQAKKLGLRSDRLAWLYRSLGMAYWESERWAEMIDAYTEAATLDPGLFSDHSSMGIAYQHLGDAEAAIAQYEKAVSLQPCNANSRGLLAAAYEAQGRIDEALAQYRTAVESDPNDFTAWNSIAVILEAQGHTEEARDAYEKAAAGARVQLEKYPDNSGVAYMLGAILFMIDDYEGARDAAERAVSLSPDASSHQLLANTYFALGDYTAAVGEYEAALQSDPTQTASLLGRAMSYEYLGRTDEAIAAYQAVVAVDDSYYNHLALAGLYEQKNDFASAADEYAATLRGFPAGDPGEETIRVALAGTLSKVCRLDEAVAPLGTPPADGSGPSFQYLATLAALQESQGRVDEAASTYESLVDANPDLGAAHYLVAYFHYRQGRLGEAEAAMIKATELAPMWAFAWSGLGQILNTQERLEEAEAAYRAALAQMPSDSSSLLGLADIALQRGEPEKALQYAEQALEQEPGYSAVLPDPTNGMLVSCHIYLGWIYRHLGQEEAAEDHLAAALSLAQEAEATMPDYARATHQLGVALLVSGKESEAEPYLQAAIDCDATMAAARDRVLERIRLLAPTD